MGDATNSSGEERGTICSRVQRHSLGSHKEELATVSTPKGKLCHGVASNTEEVATRRTPKSKGQISGHNGNDSSCKVKDQPKQEKEKTKTALPKIKEQTNADIAVH